MKRFVNGVETELGEPDSVEVLSCADRLQVRTEKGSFSAVAVRSGDRVDVSYRGRTYRIEKAVRTRQGRHAESGEIHAPMPGQIVDVLVSEGETVVTGQKLLVLEAMKTQQAFSSPFDGSVQSLNVVPGAQVNEGELLLVVAP